MTGSTIRSLERGVQMLQAVNQFNGARPADISAATGIPRPSVYRLLETLEELGLVMRDHFSNKWRPTFQAKSLSCGVRDEDWVCQIALPHMKELGRQVLWPLDLVTLRNNQIEVRESTHQTSPYSIDHGMVGRLLPVLETSSGRAMLAFMSDDERAAILELLAEISGTQTLRILADGSLDHILGRVRALGVGYRSADFTPETESISAPIWHQGRVFACLTLVWSARAMKMSRALDLYRDRLLATAAQISEELTAHLGAGTVTALHCAR